MVVWGLPTERATPKQRSTIEQFHQRYTRAKRKAGDWGAAPEENFLPLLQLQQDCYSIFDKATEMLAA